MIFRSQEIRTASLILFHNNHLLVFSQQRNSCKNWKSWVSCLNISCKETWLTLKTLFLTESLLDSSEGLSPLTLEMVQTALIGLKQKKSIQQQLQRKQQKRQVRFQQQQQQQQRSAPRKPFIKPNKPPQKLKQPRNFFPDIDLISVKGEAPLLLPHPGKKSTAICC